MLSTVVGLILAIGLIVVISIIARRRPRGRRISEDGAAGYLYVDTASSAVDSSSACDTSAGGSCDGGGGGD